MTQAGTTAAGVPTRPTARLSVVVPMYNVEPYIGEAVASVLGSTFSDLELILVDDGSTDQTLALARQAAADDPRVQVLTQPNGGAGAARNAGMARAVGQYLTFADADDIVEPKHFEKAIADLDRTGSDFCVTTHRRLMPGGELLPAHGWRLFRSQRLQITVDDYPEIMSAVSASAKVYRREFATTIGLRFDEGGVNEDQVPSALSYVSARWIDVLTHPAFRYRMRTSGDSTMDQRFTARFEAGLADALRRGCRLVGELGGPRLQELWAARALAGRVVFPPAGQIGPDTTDYLTQVRAAVADLWAAVSPAARAQLSNPARRGALYLAAEGSTEELTSYLAAGGLEMGNWEFRPAADRSGLIGTLLGNGKAPVTVDLPEWVRRGGLTNLARHAVINKVSSSAKGLTIAGECTVETLRSADLSLGLAVRQDGSKATGTRLAVTIVDLTARPRARSGGEDLVFTFEAAGLSPDALGSAGDAARLEASVTQHRTTVGVPLTLELDRAALDPARRAGIVFVTDDRGVRIAAAG